MKCPKCGKQVDQLLEVEPNMEMCDACLENHLTSIILRMEQDGLVERYGANWRLTEKGKLISPEELDKWQRTIDAFRAQGVLNLYRESKVKECNKCGKPELIGYPYRGKWYCHECFRPIVDMVNEADAKYRDGRDVRRSLIDFSEDYIFWPSADQETRKACFWWTVADLLKEVNAPSEIVYAWVKTGLLPPEWGHFLHQKFLPEVPPVKLKKAFTPLTAEELATFHQAQKEYRDLQEYYPWRAVEEEAKKLPQAEQWVVVEKLENGESSVLTSQWGISTIALFSYERAREFVTGALKMGGIGLYEPDGNKIFRVVDHQAIPRTDYDPRKHDTFHLRLGPARTNEAQKLSVEATQALGLVVDFKRPGTAFDVMDSLYRLCEGTKDYGLVSVLRQSHPIVWTPQMTMTAYHAVSELNEPLTVEADVMFINPALWLFSIPIYEGCRAELAADPFTEDGHIPFPDELVGDLGAPIVAILFNLTDTEIRAKYFYLIREPVRIEVRDSHLKLGSQPDRYEQQTTLKWLRFAASPYLIVTRHHVERHIRRRVEGRLPQVTGGVGVILLRRAERIYEARGEGRGEGEVNWSCQWWVSGHWRHQWYPSSQRHKPVWIAPYIKGPPDKPLKEAVRLMVR